MKKLFALLLTLAMVLSLAACGAKEEKPAETPAEKPAEAPAEEAIEITFPTMWIGTSTMTQWWADRIAAFNAEYAGKINVKVEEIAGDQNYVDKMKVLYSSNSLPDVFACGGYNLIDSMKDQLVDLTPYMDDELKSHGSQLCWDVNSRDGKIYGVPQARQVIGYFYNKDLFAQAGIEKPAETWDEFFAQCDKLLAAGITPLSMDTADSGWVTSLMLGAMIAQNDAGEEFMNTLLPKDYNTPEFIAAAANIQNMFQKYTTPDAIGGAYENAAANFFMEETAIIANGPWMVSDFYDPNMVEDGFAEKIGCAMYPGGVMYNSGKIGYNVASKDEEHIKASIEFIKFINSEESQRLFLEMTGETPSMEGITSDNVKPQVNEVLALGDAAKRNINDFQSLWYANVVDEISVQYPLLAQGQITPEQFAQALTDAAAKN